MDSAIKNLIRVGRVSSVNAANCTARVAFEAQGIVSYDLPIIVPQTMKNKDYALPDVGEQVLCIFLPTGNAAGFILGSLYSTVDKPPLSSADKRGTTFSDGTHIEYDRSSNTLMIDCKGPINIIASGNVHVTGDVIADGISLKTHTHGGIIPGGGSTAGPD